MKRSLKIGVVIVVLIVAAIGAFTFYLSLSNHEITFNFEDGSSTSIHSLSIDYQDKPVKSITYAVTNQNWDLSQYTPYFTSSFGTKTLTPNGQGEWTLTIFEIANYSLNDGVYIIRLIPAGTITENDKPVKLPNPLEFKLKVEDNRHIQLIIG